MKLIADALKEKGLTPAQLSTDLQEEINDLRDMQIKYNEACDEYESLEEKDRDDDTEKDLDSMEDSITEVELEIVEKIKALQPEQQQQQGQQTQQKPAEKSDSSIGWLLFGGVALVVTLGVVNVFKKK